MSMFCLCGKTSSLFGLGPIIYLAVVRLWFFRFVQKFVFGQHELEYFFLLSRKARIFFLQNLTLDYITKTLNLIFFSSTKIRISSQIGPKSNRLLSNRPQFKSASSQIGPKSNRPQNESYIGPKK